jgi:SOS-response transcriptional repressor LexA
VCMYASYDDVRTFVKGLANVPSFCEGTYMPTIGETLLALKHRADVSLDSIAESGGYSRRSSVQEYFKPTYTGPLTAKAAEKLAKGLSGRGSPPIQPEEVIALAALPPSNAVTFKFEGSSLERMREELPIWGSALGGSVMIGGHAIEQTTLNTGEIIGYAKRPVILNGRTDVYGLYVQGSSMVPAHAEGAFRVVERNRPVRSGDDAVVYIRASGEMDEADDGSRSTCVLIKRFVRRTAEYVELFQFTPELTFRIPAKDVLRMDDLLT